MATIAAGIHPLLSNGGVRLREHQTPGHYSVSVDGETEIDWTSGQVVSRARVALPRIVFDRNDPDFGRPGTETSITGARSRARRQAHEAATLQLMEALQGMRLDARFSVRQKMAQDLRLRESMAQASSAAVIRSRNTGEGYVAVELALPFHEDRGLYSMLVGSHYNSSPVPVYEPLDVVDEVTGLVIDMREFADFVPSLEPRIFTDQGRQIYGPEMVTRRCAVKYGLAGYYTNSDEARADRRVGSRPFYTFAAGLLGSGRSDLYLDAADAERVLAHASGRQALRYCSVVFVVRP